MRTKIIGLVDCDSFFASCEKVFRPDWRNRPVVVLSNNDGCVVARSPEAKALQIPMGEPYFKLKNFARARGVIVRSANYALYGDMSRRVTTVLENWTENVDVYSIDEAFLELTGQFCNADGRFPGETQASASEPPLTVAQTRKRVQEWPNGPALGELPTETVQKLDALANEIVETTRKWTGIPVSLGLGPTRTLAKAASRIAKDEFAKTGKKYALLFDQERRNEALKRLPVEKVWGVGRRIAPVLIKSGVRNAFELAKLDPNFMRQSFSIEQERLVRELRGERVYDAITAPAPQRSMQVSRSFGETIETLDELAKPVSTFAAKIAAKLRARALVANGIYVYLMTSRFNERRPQRFAGDSFLFARPTNSSFEIVQTANSLLRKLYAPGYEYKKAGVVALETATTEEANARRYLFELEPERSQAAREREAILSSALDRLNARFGQGAVFFASEGVERKWRPNSEFVSPCYTTDWDALPCAH